MDHPARVHHVVGGVQDPALGETIRVLGFGELVVRRAAPPRDSRSRAIVSAERTPPVAHGANTSPSTSTTSSAPTLLGVELRSRAPSRARRRRRPGPGGSRLRERARERLAHRAHALDRDRPPVEIVGAERVRDRGPHPDDHAVGRGRRGGARAAGRLGLGEHEGGALADDVHVGGRGVHVARGPVRAVERLDQIPVAEQEVASGSHPWGSRAPRAPPCRRRAGARPSRSCSSSPTTGGGRPAGRPPARRRSSCACRRRRDRAPSSARRRTSTPRSARRTGRRPPRRPRPGAGPRTRATRTARWTSWPSSPRASP